MSNLIFKENILLSEYCTLGIGGPASYFTEAHSVLEMQNILRQCQERKIKFMILGKGSNCFFDDRGFSGVIILNKIEGIKEIESGKFTVGAGYSFSLLGTQTARQGWSGLEFACGIPGSVGGAVFMNAGANGIETCEHLIEVEYLSDDGKIVNLKKKDLQFSYRYSSFQRWSGVILGATFELKPSKEAREKQIQIINIRKKTQPLTEKSAGCVFRNPTGDFAGRLIETCGLKGLTLGAAQVSLVHGNFLINIGKATCKEFQELIKVIQQRVQEKTGYYLEMEVRHIPYE